MTERGPKVSETWGKVLAQFNEAEKGSGIDSIWGHIWATLGHFGSFFTIFGPFCGMFEEICGKFNFFAG